MKKIIYSAACLAFFALFSCRKAHHEILGKTVTIDTTLASGTTYTLDLKSYGDADDIATIKQQASNFTTSEIVNAAAGFAPVYHFSATGDNKNVLNEQVVLAITEGGRNGNRHPSDSTLITINFKVQ
ncbi:MAG: hypothetical protein ACXVKI_14145 [Flavisolibacter sp.]